eukprot:g771.t1
MDFFRRFVGVALPAAVAAAGAAPAPAPTTPPPPVPLPSELEEKVFDITAAPQPLLLLVPLWKELELSRGWDIRDRESEQEEADFWDGERLRGWLR